jgi:hypothetical protein
VTSERLVAAALVLGALTGCGDQTDHGDQPADVSVGGPDRAVDIEQAREAVPGVRLRVRGALVLTDGQAVMCAALAESNPPQCPNGLELSDFDAQILPPNTPSAGDVRWLESLEIIAVRTTEGLKFLDS